MSIIIIINGIHIFTKYIKYSKLAGSRLKLLQTGIADWFILRVPVHGDSQDLNSF